MSIQCNLKTNLERCNCSCDGCPRKGACCECLAYHIDKRQLPACFFPDDVERTWNRSFEKFAELVQAGRV